MNRRSTEPAQSAQIHPTESAALDILRFLLSMAVVVSHISQPAFASAIPWDLSRLGILAVGGFFALSGYTMSLITLTGSPRTPSQFLAERFARLMSVCAPALLLTLLLDALSARIAPGFYIEHWGHWPDWQGANGLLAALCFNLALFTQSHGLSAPLLSNSPLWSLSYELGFYALFAAWLAWRQRPSSGWLLPLAGLVFGPQVLFMFLFFGLGGALHRASALAKGALPLMAFFLAALVLIVLEVTASKFAPMWAPSAVLVSVFPALGLDAGRISGLLLRGVWGFVLVMSAGLLLIRWTDWRVGSAIRQRLRYLGSLTFPLYVVHFPVLVALKPSGHWLDHSAWLDLAALMGVMIFARALLRPSEAIKRWLTRKINARLL